MILTIRVLRSTRLTTHIPALELSTARRTPHIHTTPHTLNNGLVVHRIDHRIVTLIKASIYRVAPLDTLDDMGYVVVTPIGNNSCEVSHLQRRTTHLSLTNSTREHRAIVPLTILTVVELGSRHKARTLTIEVATELTTEAKAIYIVVPFSHTLAYRAILRIQDNIFEDITEVGVARRSHSIAQIDRRAVRVTLHLTATIAIALVARVHIAWSQDALLQAYESLHKFECRAWRILSLYRAVKLWITLVVKHLCVVVVTLLAHHKVGIVRRRGYHN